MPLTGAVVDRRAREVEARAMAILLPFLRRRAHDGQLVVTSKGLLARHFQETTPSEAS